MVKNIFIGVDADNTIWDTDAVFADVQVRLLRKIENSVDSKKFAKNGLKYIREIDQEVARLHSFNLKYPVEILVRATECALLGKDPKTSARIAVEECKQGKISDKYLEDAEWFLNELKQIVPKLRDGVSDGLKAIANMWGKVSIFTEGHRDKCDDYLKIHKLDFYVDEIIECRKSVEFYNEIISNNSHKFNQFYMIGDQLDRDICFSKKAGFKTIYFPGGFLPEWVDITDNRCVDFEINSFTEVVTLIS